MRTVILSQRKERDTLLAKDYLPRDNQKAYEVFLASPLIKLITGPRRAGKSVSALLLLKDKNFAYLNFDDERLLERFDEDVVLQVKTGRIFVELTMESTIKEIEEVCKKDIPYGFEINQDRANYIRKEKTVSDRIKYGDMDLPDELIGMTDQYSSFEDHVKIIRKDDFD